VLQQSADKNIVRVQGLRHVSSASQINFASKKKAKKPTKQQLPILFLLATAASI
jgi:hypothetical protein